MNIWKRLFILLCITVPCIGCDQATKSLAAEHLPTTHMISYAHDVLRIGYVENTGAFLGMGSNLPESARFWIFVVISGALLIALLGYLLFSRQTTLIALASLALIFAGGLSNLHDRIINNGAVIDFLNIGFGSLRTGIFNVADIAIMAGAMCLLLPLSHSTASSQ